ncbi:MAG TPA: hypothetical protein VHZ99_00860 [Steroidobacteraceae bacterium]|jgi:hypothetical protein|nr:hypothetical protein [Steroidobacteraceae bacterium]
MGRSILLYLPGVPVSIIILIASISRWLKDAARGRARMPRRTSATKHGIDLLT